MQEEEHDDLLDFCERRKCKKSVLLCVIIHLTTYLLPIHDEDRQLATYITTRLFVYIYILRRIYIYSDSCYRSHRDVLDKDFLKYLPCVYGANA